MCDRRLDNAINTSKLCVHGPTYHMLLLTLSINCLQFDEKISDVPSTQVQNQAKKARLLLLYHTINCRRILYIPIQFLHVIFFYVSCFIFIVYLLYSESG